MNFGKKTILFFSTGFCLGNIPFAPGTFGSLLGLFVCFFLSKTGLIPSLFFIGVLIVSAVWLSEKTERWLGQKDPACIVIDEIAGMAVTLAGLPFNAATAGIGFILFRVLDILKPFPIRALEKKISGGVGIVLDDVLAGIIANIALRILIQAIDII